MTSLKYVATRRSDGSTCSQRRAMPAARRRPAIHKIAKAWNESCDRA